MTSVKKKVKVCVANETEVNAMLQQPAIPRTPEEVAMFLSKLTEKEQYMVKGIIIGMAEARAVQDSV